MTKIREKNRNIEKVSNLIRYAIWLVLGFFIITFISALVESSQYRFSLNISAINHFIEICEIPLKTAAALVAIFTIWLTLERMKQTKQQLEEISYNNRFNNYFLHKEEFIKEFKDNDFFIEFSKTTSKDVIKELKFIYNSFYYKSAKNFKPEINTETSTKINALVNMINDYGLNTENKSLNSIENAKLYDISKDNLIPIKLMITAIHSKLIPKMKSISKENNDKKSGREYTQFLLLNELFWSCVFYQALLRFDGKTESITPHFAMNFIDYREQTNYYEAISRL